MRNFAAIAYNEVLLNSKRVAPYAVAILCAGNGLLWWGWGPATGRGLAINSDCVIASVLPIYAFLFLPLFTAVIMADPAIRDFQTGIEPLIFSKPVSRAEYLLGKFFGNFFVLACCQSAFVLTWFVLQAVPKQGVTTQDWKLFPYIKHFLVFVVISHLLLAAFYFTVGTLTRSAKIVYGLGLAFYPVYIAYQSVVLSSLPWRWKLALDPLVMNRRPEIHSPNVEMMNHLVVVYDTDLIVNRVVIILLTAGCLTILYKLFSTTERSSGSNELTVINLSTAAERVYYQGSSPFDQFEPAVISPVDVPEVVTVNEGIHASVNKLLAALSIEFRLLRAERSLVVVMPLALFLSIVEVAFYNIPPDVSHSAAYATNTAKLMLLFLIGIAVFYTNEAMHRDNEIRIEPMLWAAPASNSVLLLSKFLATFLLLVSLITTVGIAAVAIQVLRSHTPIDVIAYLRVYGIILLPGAVVLTALALLLTVILRNKYLVYVVSIGTAVGLFYLYSMGHNHWLYNPVLYGLWTSASLIDGVAMQSILWNRLYWLAIAVGCLALAHLIFPRRNGRTNSAQPR